MFVMKDSLLPFLLALLILPGCHSNGDDSMSGVKVYSKGKKGDCCNGTFGELACKLTTPEMDERKKTVLASLRRQVLDKEELDNGYRFKFVGTDSMINELTEFAKTERHCCDFFTFNLTMSGDTSTVWFEITGPAGAKEIIGTELEL